MSVLKSCHTTSAITTLKKMTEYSIGTDITHGSLQLIDIDAIVAACDHPWFNQTLCSINDCVVRLGILKGEFHWHKHDDEDEFFFVVDGQLFIDLEERGVMHNTRAPKGVVVLMMEGKGVVPTGD
jgi:hypothetical protein